MGELSQFSTKPETVTFWDSFVFLSVAAFSVHNYTETKCKGGGGYEKKHE